MKYIALLVSLLLMASGIGRCAKPVFMVTNAESKYVITQSTITISSSTVTNIGSTDRYRSIRIGGVPTYGSNIFYRIDGSSTNVYAVGLWISTGTISEEIETNGPVSLLLPPGVASYVIRLLTVEK